MNYVERVNGGAQRIAVGTAREIDAVILSVDMGEVPLDPPEARGLAWALTCAAEEMERRLRLVP